MSGTLTASVQGIDDQNGLRHAAFRYRWTATEGTTDTVVQDSENPIYVLEEADEGKTVQVDATFTDDDGYEETLHSVPTGAIGPRPNRPATGDPTIVGTVQVGETLTVDISDIEDADGLDNVSFSYQWLAGDADIAGATGDSYTLVADDKDKTISVRVSFTDRRDFEETLTSAATAPVDQRVDFHILNAPVGEHEAVLYRSTASLTPVNHRGDTHDSREDRPADFTVTGGPTVTLPALDRRQVGELAAAIFATALTIPLTSIDGLRVGESIEIGAGGGELMRIASVDSDDKAITIVERYKAHGESFVEPSAWPADTVVYHHRRARPERLQGYMSGSGEKSSFKNFRMTWQGVDVPYLAINVSFSGSDTELKDWRGLLVYLRFRRADGEGRMVEGILPVGADGEMNLDHRQPGDPYTVREQHLRRYLGWPENLGSDPDASTKVSFADDAQRLDRFISGPERTFLQEIVDWIYADDGHDLGRIYPLDDRYDADEVEALQASPETVSEALVRSYQVVLDVAFLDGADPRIDAEQFSILTWERADVVDLGDIGGAIASSTRSGSVNRSGDEYDHYSFTLSVPREVQLELTNLSGAAELVLESGSRTHLLRSDESGLQDELIITVLDAGVYQVRVQAQGGGTIDYQLRYRTALPAGNSPATGVPSISGTAQVGETLTVDTSGIGDDDGLPAESEFDYQWIAGTTDISGATWSTYTLVADDAGLTIQVKVSFFDDKNNQETLTSAATAAVQTQEPNSLPTVTGPTDVDYAENSVSSVATYIAMDPEGEAIEWSVSGTDHVLFSITSGVLELLTPPNYENPIDEGEDNGYLVDVTATDSSGAAVTIAVTVTVTDVYDPNIVLVMADEGGYELFGAYGSTQYRTPRIDEIAAASVRFTHAYSKPGSTPSRVALMTGKSNVRNYVDWGTLLPGEYTIADLFSDAGYATAIAGKWQLQGRPNYITGVAAEESGFDTYCLWYSDISERRYWQPTFECDGQVIDYAALDYGPDELVDFLDEFIESNQDKPFFAYYSMLLPHAPFDALPPTAQCADADNAQCVFEDMVAYMDYNVGRIYDKLESLGLLDNTVFLFTSDNGTPESKVSHLDGEAIHGEKGEPTDGGTHVPLIVHAPGATGGQVIDDLIDFTDFLPTLADAAGLTLPADVTVDGQSFWDRLQGGSGNLREWIYTYYFPEPYTDRWTFPREHPEVAYVRNKTFKLYASGDLYDLSVDRHEVRPLAEDDEDSHAARAALQAVLDSMPEQGQEIVWNSVLTPPPATEPRPRWRPVLRSATVNGAELSLAYAGGLKTQANPGSDAFSVEVEGTGRTVTSVSLTEEEVTLTLASAVTVGQTVTVSYTLPSEKPLRRKYESKGNKAAALTEEPVRNDTGLAPPTFTATGAPSIGGTAQVGETLTVDTSGIDDEDGLANVSFSYQWLANDAEIAGATDPTYTLVDDDAGLTIKVKVSFFDDENNQETLTSAGTAAVDPDPGPMTGITVVDASDQSVEGALADGGTLALDDPVGGSFGIRADLESGATIGSMSLELTGAKTHDQTENIAPYSLYGDSGGNLSGESLPVGEYTLTATAYSEARLGGNVLGTLKVSFTVTETATQQPNSPATGAPTISGIAQVGETLRADISGIADVDGMSGAVFSYQWLANEVNIDTDIAGATDPTYTLVADDVGKAIRVRVSFTDGASNVETLTSEATATVVTPLTAEFQGAPDKHDGTGFFTFVIDFSEPISISYKTLRDDSLEVTNGSATKAKRVNGQSDRWEITVEPDSDADVTVVLPVTGDCTTQDAVCTRDGTKLSNRSELTVPGPAAANTPATGAPTISGTVQVGKTLTVETSAIADADGMSKAVFTYQWLADGVDIAGATSDTYTPVADDVGKAVKVRVIFNDDDNNEETLTSAATAAVAAETAVPDAPQSLNVSPDDTGTLDVSWEAPASDGGSAITGYKVQWKSGSEDYDGSAGSTRQAEITDPASRTHTITGLTDGVEYAVRVIAVNDVGDGPPSDEATGTPRETTPPELSTATVDGTTLTLTYDEALDENSEPSSDAFSVTVGGTGRAVDGVSVSGSSVILTLGSAVSVRGRR